MNTYRKLFAYIPQFRVLALGAVLASGLSAALTTCGYYAINCFLYALIADQNMSRAQSLAFVIASFLLAGTIFRGASGLMAHYIGFHLENALRKRGVEGLSRASFTFSYQGTKKNIVNISSLAIACNQITAIVGKNGAGKTTFLNCFCGLEKTCKGSFEYEGRALSNQERKKLCFMVMQNTGNQLFSESVFDEVLMSLPKHTNKRQEAALNILRQLDLEFLTHRHPQSLSGCKAVVCRRRPQSDKFMPWAHLLASAAVLRWS